MARFRFTVAVEAITPPWLQRTIGEKFMQGLAAPLDDLTDAVVQGVKQRFPNVVDDSSIDRIGRERRIRRGPGESASTYAPRLRRWWDDHRRRGNAYALLAQLHAYWLETLNVPIDVVAHSGLRHAMDVDGAIVRDQITWGADGSDLWAQIWIVFRLGDDLSVFTDELVTELADGIVDESEDPIIAVGTGVGGTITSTTAESLRAIPREWSAAHIFRTTIVLLYGVGELWDYPGPSDDDDWTWDTWEATGATWDEDAPVLLTIEGA